MNTDAASVSSNSLIEELQTVLGTDAVLSDDASRTLYSQDVFTRSTKSLVVVQPTSTEALASAVKLITSRGIAVVPRGGGMSYTSGYVPASENSVTVDLSKMNRVVEINTEDMFVTVEAGCTWESLYKALADTDLRTPYWGTLSGRYATVGGSASQNAIFWGSGQYGTVADNIIGLEVVLADGSRIKTGSAAQVNSTPFFRHFGPDLTGLFCCDAGALGFKATLTLRLVPKLSGRAYCAFDFKTPDDTLAAMSEIARQGLAMECFGFDPFLQSQRLKRESLAKDVQALAGVMKASGSITGALKEGAKVALAGRRYMQDVDYSVQIMVEDFSQAGADEKARRITAIARHFEGREISNSIPKIARANPFGPVNAMLGPQGERWVPSHVIVPHSKVQESHELIMGLFDEFVKQFEQHSIETGFLFTVIATNGFVLEPVFFWPDVAAEFHQTYVEADHLKNLPKLEEDLAARKVVETVRHRMAAMFKDRGGVHLQIGKEYHYADGISAEALATIRAVKAQVDPQNLVNPGALGL